jgi:hypothetical protein
MQLAETIRRKGKSKSKTVFMAFGIRRNKKVASFPMWSYWLISEKTAQEITATGRA